MNFLIDGSQLFRLNSKNHFDVLKNIESSIRKKMKINEIKKNKYNS